MQADPNECPIAYMKQPKKKSWTLGQELSSDISTIFSKKVQNQSGGHTK
jgi:hypothetical protein